MNQRFEIIVSDMVDMERPMVEMYFEKKPFADISYETDDGPILTIYDGKWEFLLAEFLPFFEKAINKSRHFHTPAISTEPGQ